ncbi:hypothetical protein V6Z11_D08G023200 [Gossypium hirsutum]
MFGRKKHLKSNWEGSAQKLWAWGTRHWPDQKK